MHLLINAVLFALPLAQITLGSTIPPPPLHIQVDITPYEDNVAVTCKGTGTAMCGTLSVTASLCKSQCNCNSGTLLCEGSPSHDCGAWALIGVCKSTNLRCTCPADDDC